jgi:hypothetical protein
VDLDDLSAASAPSGSVASFTGVSSGTHAVTVTIGGSTVFTGSLEVGGGDVTAVTITLSVTGVATPGVTVVDPGPGTSLTPETPRQPATGIMTLPSTGAETGAVDSVLVWLLLLASAGLVGLAGVMVWRRRS